MSYRPHPPPSPLLFGYDPVRDLPPEHLARLVEAIVEETVVPPPRPRGDGQPPFDPRLCLKVLLYGYSTGIRSSRKLEELCRESLPYLYLTRGDTPSYRTLCSVREKETVWIEAVYRGLLEVAAAVGLSRVGRITLDSTKIRADVSPESVVKQAEYEAVRQELEQILAEAAAVDAREEAEGRSGATVLAKRVEREQMRQILRRVRREERARKKAEQGAGGDGEGAGGPALPLEGGDGAGEEPQEALAESPQSSAAEGTGGRSVPASLPAGAIGQRMRVRIKAAIEALKQAQEEGRKHLSLTDTDARMMGEGRQKRVQPCHSFEVAVDQGLLVAGPTSQEGTDNARLLPLVEAARQHEPGGVSAVDADSGYYSGDAVAALIEAGVDTCIPDSNTAGDLHRRQPVGTVRQQQQGQVAFEYDPQADLYRCPEGNLLTVSQRRQQDGQETKVYRARNECRTCPLAGECLTQAKARYRTLKVAVKERVIEAARQRFDEPEQRERYRRRAPAVEGVFGFVRGTLGYDRWLLRGAEKVAREGRLFTLAYQLRKVHPAWGGA